MFRSVNVDVAVEHLKNIVDSIRCAVCDRIDGTRMRYPCGHTSCEDCVVLASDCSVCLTPLLQSDSRELVVDIPFTQRAANALNLLNVFQNEFHLDVYKRHRISEQLKAEREVFPECIQAPAKYFNKRKSFHNTKVEKENKSQFPGEEISLVKNLKMGDRSENVKIWLNKYVDRKPFAELNSNDETLRMNTRTIKKQQNLSNNENIPLKSSNRKRSHSKTRLSKLKNQTLIVDNLTPLKITKTRNIKSDKEKKFLKADTSKYFKTGTNINTTDNTESGIVMDDEAVIVIDDSQIVVDKDMNAWLAVLEADHNKQYESTSYDNKRSLEMIPLEDKATEAKKNTKVPFYLKGYLSECIESVKCINCNRSNQVPDIMNVSNNKSTIDTESKDISITVENKHFITVIKIKQTDETENKICMKSCGVNTDTPGITTTKDNIKNLATSSQNLCQNSGKIENARKEMNVNVKKQTSGNFENATKDINVNMHAQDNDKLENDNKKININKHDNVNTNINVNLNKTANVVIPESDSDTDLEESLSLEVTAEIHRSCEEVDYGILTDVDNLEDHTKRARRAPRGVTPTSSNSSEKENYNPNRMKKATTLKKKPVKK